MAQIHRTWGQVPRTLPHRPITLNWREEKSWAYEIYIKYTAQPGVPSEFYPGKPQFKNKTQGKEEEEDWALGSTFNTARK